MSNGRDQALRELYDALVQVLDLTNPDLKRERRKASLLLDKWEYLVCSEDYPWLHDLRNVPTSDESEEGAKPHD